MTNERNFIIHPSYLLMFLILAGLISLFLGFTGAYLYNRIQQNVPPIQLPSLFYWNTLLLVASSGTLIWAKGSYKNDNTAGYKLALTLTLVFSLFFLLAQIYAWKQLQNQEIFINHSTMASYMYVISGLHFVHVIAGIPFLIRFLAIAYQKMKSPVSVLIYFSDTAKQRKLHLLNIYWHFLDALWIYLVVFFLLNYLVQ